MAKIYVTLKFNGSNRSRDYYTHALAMQMVQRKKHLKDYLTMAFLGYAGAMDPARSASNYHLN